MLFGPCCLTANQADPSTVDFVYVKLLLKLTVLLACSTPVQFAANNRDAKMLDIVMATLRNDGSVLMPVDTAGRVLELMLLLEKHWAQNRLSYTLALLAPVAYNTLEFAKTQLEWMNEQVAKGFDSSRDKDNPFSMRLVPQQCPICELPLLTRCRRCS